MVRWCAWLGALALAIGAGPAGAAEHAIVLASTTSTENSGLFGHILPEFEAETGIAVRVVAVGTGQALKLARNGDADVLLVHHRPSEEAFVAEGYGVERFDVMYNDFVLVGPRADPAGIAGLESAAGALARIAESEAVFASRGDDSGTHKAERALWAEAGTDPSGASGGWYRELGQGMGATLNAAAAMDAYTLTDRATWLSFANKGNLRILVEGDPALFNQYGVILVNPERYPHVNAADGQAFIDWLLSPAGQGAIAAFRVGGAQLFFPNAKPR
jgi:tungstate transport system substrate-binding protein